MKNNYTFFLMIFLSAVCYSGSVLGSVKVYEERPVQNAYGRNIISLNGQWNYIPDPYETGYYNHRYEVHTRDGFFRNAKAQSPTDLVEYNFATADKIQVPGDWNSQEERLFLYEGTIWYQRDFKLKKVDGLRHIIHFGAVNYHARVWVNGKKVGSHVGGFTSFQFDISDAVVKGDNFVVVKVDNRRERDQVPTVNTDWWNYGGITRPVAILALPETYLADYEVQLQAGSATSIKASVSLGGKVPRRAQSVKLVIPELKIDQTINLDGQGKGSVLITANPALWSPESPKLYDVELIYNKNSVKDRIGFRTITTRGEDILLNGESIFLRGISIHEEAPYDGGRAWSEDHARTTLRWAKELGANFVRLAHYPHNEAMVRVADEMGLLVWSEIPVYWTVQFEKANVYANAENQLVEMISRDKNRASIVLWSVANETPLHEARTKFLADLVRKTRELDDTRLLTAAMDTQSTTDRGIVIDDPLVDLIDVIGINSYCGWYYEKPDNCAKLRWHSDHNKPMIMSEFGAGAVQGRYGDKYEVWTEEHQAYLYEITIEMMSHIKAMRGVSPWILKDFRSPRRPLANIQDLWNRKGLLSERGIKKQAWQVLHDYYEDKKRSWNKTAQPQ